MGRTFELNMPHGDKIDIDTDKLFDIDETNLTKEYAKQASLYAYYGTLYNEADRALMKSDAYKDSLYAELDLEYRKELQDEKATEGRIKSMVISDADYEKSVTQVTYCTYRKGVLKTIMDALKMRADMLVSMGAHLRAEYDQTGMVIRNTANIAEVREKLRKKSEQV